MEFHYGIDILKLPFVEHKVENILNFANLKLQFLKWNIVQTLHSRLNEFLLVINQMQDQTWLPLQYRKYDFFNRSKTLDASFILNFRILNQFQFSL